MENLDSAKGFAPNDFPVNDGCWPARVDHNWQNQVVLQYMPLVKTIAFQTSTRLPSCILLDDLVSAGIMGLIDAIHKFDPEKKPDFKAYAEIRIIGAILDELRGLDWVPRSVRKKQRLYEGARDELQRRLGRPVEAEEVAGLWDMPLEEFHAFLREINPGDTQSLTEDFLGVFRQPEDYGENETLPDILWENGNPLATLELGLMKKIMFQSVGALPEKLKTVVNRYYFQELTMTEIGALMEYTQSRISQLHKDAIRELRLQVAPQLGSWEIIEKPIPVAANRKNSSGHKKHRKRKTA